MYYHLKLLAASHLKKKSGMNLIYFLIYRIYNKQSLNTDFVDFVYRLCVETR